MENPRKIEIMSPAGNFECLQAAIQGGADSVYFGVEHLNMRSHSANNFRIEDLPEICSICSRAGVRTYLTLNIVLYDGDLADMRRTLEAARTAGVSAVIASDMAAIACARSLGIEVHISTQLSISNSEALRFYSQYADVIVLARELNLHQVREIHETILRDHITGPSGRPVEIEMFVHGALCMAISGKCYLSLHEYGASANRGACYQICRRGYEVTDLETGSKLLVDNKYIMSPKDLCTIEFLDKIIASGVTVLKIEGRARSAEYVRKVTSCYRRAADAVLGGSYTTALAAGLKEELSEVFNRGFWDGYYQGAKLGEWSEVYGSRATRKKVYCGKVTNWFDRLGVAEILVESATLRRGDRILVIGSTTGAEEMDVREIRVDLQPVEEASKGVYCSIPCFEPALETTDPAAKTADTAQRSRSTTPKGPAGTTDPAAKTAYTAQQSRSTTPRGPAGTPDPVAKATAIGEATAAGGQRATNEGASATDRESPRTIHLRRGDKVYIWEETDN